MDEFCDLVCFEMGGLARFTLCSLDFAISAVGNLGAVPNFQEKLRQHYYAAMMGDYIKNDVKDKKKMLDEMTLEIINEFGGPHTRALYVIWVELLYLEPRGYRIARLLASVRFG
jgi:hypothetical protein